MKLTDKPQKMIGCKVTEEFRDRIERLIAAMATRRRRRVTITDVLVEGVELLAKKEKVS